MNKRISVGLVVEIEIKIDKHNNTYSNDIDFIKDKDKILNIINRDIDINLFDIEITDEIKLKLKNNLINNINEINKVFNKHLLYKFNKSNNKSLSIRNMYCNNLIDEYNLNEIDKDPDSLYYPIDINYKAIELFITKDIIDIKNINNIFALLKSYSNEYFDNLLSSLLLYGIEKE